MGDYGDDYDDFLERNSRGNDIDGWFSENEDRLREQDLFNQED